MNSGRAVAPGQSSATPIPETGPGVCADARPPLQLRRQERNATMTKSTRGGTPQMYILKSNLIITDLNDKIMIDNDVDIFLRIISSPVPLTVTREPSRPCVAVPFFCELT